MTHMENELGEYDGLEWRCSVRSSTPHTTARKMDVAVSSFGNAYRHTAAQRLGHSVNLQGKATVGSVEVTFQTVVPAECVPCNPAAAVPALTAVGVIVGRVGIKQKRWWGCSGCGGTRASCCRGIRVADARNSQRERYQRRHRCGAQDRAVRCSRRWRLCIFGSRSGAAH